MMLAQLGLFEVSGGLAIVIVGLLGMLLWAAVKFRSPIAVIMWGLSVITLIITAIYGVGETLFWFGIIMTAILLLVTLTARVSNA